MKIKLKIMLYFYILVKYNFFFLNKKIKKILFYINNFMLCINCHNNSYTYFPEIYKIPIILNQNKKYLERSFFFYKNFNRKSLFMNIISNYLTIKEFNNILFFFNSNE